MSSKSDKHALLDETMASGHLHARREPRIPMRLEIEVCGFSSDSNPFRVRTFTLDISDWGCRFEMPFRLDPNSIFTVQALKDDKGEPVETAPVMFQSVRALEFRDHWEIAAWKMAPDKVWPVDIPSAPPEDPGEAAGMRKNDA
jgi:hypothetical protein